MSPGLVDGMRAHGPVAVSPVKNRTNPCDKVEAGIMLPSVKVAGFVHSKVKAKAGNENSRIAIIAPMILNRIFSTLPFRFGMFRSTCFSVELPATVLPGRS